MNDTTTTPPGAYRHPERCIDCKKLYPEQNPVEGGAVCDACKAIRIQRYGADDWQRDRRPPEF